MFSCLMVHDPTQCRLSTCEATSLPGQPPALVLTLGNPQHWTLTIFLDPIALARLRTVLATADEHADNPPYHQLTCLEETPNVA